MRHIPSGDGQSALGRGFERYYGFLGGDTSQWYPDLVYDNDQVEPPRRPQEGYHLTEDLIDKSIQFIADAKQVTPDKPFYLHLCFGATHAPHHVPKQWADRYAGQFDDGWDAYRERVFARQKELGLFPADTTLSRHDPDVPAWESLTPDARRLSARMMEVFAGFVRPTVWVMTKRRHGRHPKGGRVTPKGTRPAGAPGPSWSTQDREPDLMHDVRRRLQSGEPLDLLAEVSSLLEVVDPREYGFGRRDGEPPYSLRELVDMFLDVDRIETSAMLAVVAELTDDEILAARIRRGLAERGDRLPEWLTRLGEAEVYRAQEMVHVLGDGDNVHVAVRFAGGAELTAVVYIDHNMGTLVKDAFVVSESMAELEVFMRAKVDDPDTAWRDLDLADARVRLTEAIERAAMTVPPFETDTWPVCRPIVEWLTRQMPAGGVGYQRPEWSERDQQQLADRFFDSPFGAPLDDADHRGLLESVIWFGTDYGPGDPLRWSPVAVEIILEDWIPRKLVADAAYLSKAPDLLRAFVRFCHAERGIRADLTRDTLAAIDIWEPDYQRTIRSPRPQGPMAILAAIGAIDPEGPWPMGDRDLGDEGLVAPFDLRDHRAFMRELLREAAGSDDALRALDDRPLPNEDFDWAGIPDDVRDKVAEVLELTDAFCDQLLDVEYRTACRRLLARVAAGDPAVFRRRARSATAAAAICWIVGKDNDLFSPSGGRMLVKDLMAHFGLAQGGVSQRAETLLKAAGFDPSARRWDLRLGDPKLLVSRRRRRLIELRDEYLTDD